MYGAIIIDPVRGSRIDADQDFVVQLSDWTDEDPMRIFANLRKQSDYYNFNQLTTGDFVRDVSGMGMSAALGKRRMWNQMRMSPTDLADISGYAYSYLMNGATPAGNWTVPFSRGERVRLRFINSAAQTYFDVRIPGLKMTVVNVDGQNVDPVTIDELRFGPAETYDVIVTPRDDRAYTIFAQSMDRSGYARGTLTPRPGMSADVPELEEDSGASSVPSGPVDGGIENRCPLKLLNLLNRPSRFSNPSRPLSSSIPLNLSKSNPSKNSRNRSSENRSSSNGSRCSPCSNPPGPNRNVPSGNRNSKSKLKFRSPSPKKNPLSPRSKWSRPNGNPKSNPFRPPGIERSR